MAETFAYTRVSTKRQETDGTSLKSQRERIAAYCTQKGLPEPQWFSDPAVSGKVPLADRESGGAMVERIKAGDHVVILSIDRGFRNVYDFLRWFEQWNERGTFLHVLNFGGNEVDPRTAMGKAMYRLLAVVAELERDIRSDRITEVHAHRRRNGRIYAKNTFKPGFKLVPAADGEGSVAIPDPAQRALMRRMLDWRRQGKSIEWIRQHLQFTLKEKPWGICTKWHPIYVSQAIQAEIDLQHAEQGATA